MKKLKQRKHVIIHGEIIYHGDYVSAYLGNPDNGEDGEYVDDARVCINDDDVTEQNRKACRFWICQDIKEGCTSAQERFGYNYSWVVSLNKDGEIVSSDTSEFELRERCTPEDLELEEEDESTNAQEVVDEDVDDDPMPEDWIPSEKDLLFLKN